MKMYKAFLQCSMDIVTSIEISSFVCLKYFSVAYNLLMNSSIN